LIRLLLIRILLIRFLSMVRTSHQANWLQRAVPDAASAAPYRIPLPLARQFLQICATSQAESLAGEVVAAPMRHAALACIDDFPGIEQRRLAAMINADRTNAVHIVDDLEKAGLVERRISPTDRRARELRSTAEGRALRRRLRPKSLASQARVLACLPADEQSLLIDLLARVIEANQDLLRPGAGRRRPPSKTRAAVRSAGGEVHEQKLKDTASRGRNASSRRPHADGTG
jgi:DNA-binding MarR family transcriptional regulator